MSTEPAKTEKPEKPAKTEKPEKPAKTEKPEKPAKAEKPEKAEREEKGKGEPAKEGGAAVPAKARKLRRVDSRGVVHVKATFNNTLVTITTNRGEVLCTGSAGTVGFKGTRKSTPFAAQRAAEQAASLAMRHGVREVEVKVKGAGSGRESAVRAIANSGLKVVSIEDVTPLPHNGCRARKRRRV
jgi:small subunit ribosomal protein S11